MSSRYALYFSPGDSTELAAFGNQVLGREAGGKEVLASPTDFPDRQLARSLSRVPSQYGFHATLKAPFTLSAAHNADDLLQSVESFSHSQSPIVMQGLVPDQLSGFIALSFAEQPELITRLAHRCVEHFESFRAPLTTEDMQRRNPEKLTERQREYLRLFGYPYVMDEFRFHMTLTGHLRSEGASDNQQTAYFEWLKKRYDSVLSSAPILDSLSVFWQRDRTQPFTRLEQFAFKDDDSMNNPG